MMGVTSSLRGFPNGILSVVARARPGGRSPLRHSPLSQASPIGPAAPASQRVSWGQRAGASRSGGRRCPAASKSTHLLFRSLSSPKFFLFQFHGFTAQPLFLNSVDNTVSHLISATQEDFENSGSTRNPTHFQTSHQSGQWEERRFRKGVIVLRYAVRGESRFPASSHLSGL